MRSLMLMEDWWCSLGDRTLQARALISINGSLRRDDGIDDWRYRSFLTMHLINIVIASVSISRWFCRSLVAVVKIWGVRGPILCLLFVFALTEGGLGLEIDRKHATCHRP